ncbi:Beta-xylosidase [Nocardioides terrae]|uniref:Beta-xylosidase n=1 Tax=Nocardioides terrae TaxID=574651 RepID=A0A1I1KD53_9ACTN|nr:family 43 glycosylhydrolase [Nocardioides terrae]SFC58415.1 Beta-xylosidase [Nocardioides terrae]
MRRARWAAAVSAAAILAAGLVPMTEGDADEATPRTATTATYSNPVTAGVVDTFPDPSMIRGKDGAWYAYGTTNPILNSSGETGEHLLPILRSADMVHWSYVGDAVSADAIPASWTPSSRAWAPDIRYVDGEYHLTYSLSTGGVVLATAPTPTGPWTDHGLIVPRQAVAGCPTGNIDQAMFTDSDGAHYLYWGSYDVICVSRMTADATALTGPVTQVAQGRRMEGGFVVKRNGLYYLMYSDAGCCDGAFSGYTVKVGRSHSPFGPFVDDAGVDLMSLSSKGGFVLAPNGNGFTGLGHNAVQTDLSGQDWLVYHGIDDADPDFPPVQTRAGRLQLSKRPMMIDRLDWIDGWPVVNAGAGATVSGGTAPVTTGPVDDDFAAGLGSWTTHGRVALGNETDAKAFAHLSDGATLTSHDRVTGDLRAQADVRVTSGGGAVGLRAGVRGINGAVAWLDTTSHELRVEVRHGSTTADSSSPLPADFDARTWKVLALDWRGDQVAATVSSDNLIDPLATTTVTAPRNAAPDGTVGVVARGGGDADNVSEVPASRPVTQRVADPQPGALLDDYSDEFDGTGMPGTGDAGDTAGTGWSWVRRPASGPRLEGGGLTWPTQAAELFGSNNTASVLLREAPRNDFLVETKLTFDGSRASQQAGLVLYENDDRYLKLAHSVLPLNRKAGQFLHQTEFGKEAERPTTTPPTAVADGPMFGAAPAATTWLRLYAQLDEEHDEYDVRMASSTDGERWQWGGTWSLSMRGDLRIGLVSMNATGATARFDYLRTYDMGGESARFPRSWPAATPYGTADGRDELAMTPENSQVLDLQLRPQDEALGRVWMRDTYVNRFEVAGKSLYVATGTTRVPGLDAAAPWNDGIYVWTAPSLNGPWTLTDTTGIRPGQPRGKVWSPEFVGENTATRTVVAPWQEYWYDSQFGKRGEVWAPEVHYFGGKWYIVACMGDHSRKVGSFMLVSDGGVEGPYRLIKGNEDKPFGEPIAGGPAVVAPGAYFHIDGGLYTEGDDAWLVLHNNLFAKFRDDMEDLETPVDLPAFTQRKYSPEPYLEGASVTKVGSKYYLMQSAWANKTGTQAQPTWSYLAGTGPKDQYDAVVAVADRLEGPYSARWTLGVGAGHNNMFVDDNGDLWATFFRNPAHGYWASPERVDDTAVPGIVRLERAGPSGAMLYVQRPASAGAGG